MVYFKLQLMSKTTKCGSIILKMLSFGCGVKNAMRFSRIQYYYKHIYHYLRKSDRNPKVPKFQVEI